MGDRAIRWLVGGVGLLVGIAAELVQRGNGIPAERLLIDFLVGQSYLMGGLFAWSREPRNRTWKLMAGVGIAWYVGSFADSSVPIVRDLAVVLADADAILLVALVLAYPSGRLERPSERLVVFGGAVGLTLGNVMLLLVHDGTVALVVGLAVTVAMAILVPRRWLLATPRQRHLLAPTLVATGITLLAIGAAIVVRLADLPSSVERFVLASRDVALLAIPLGFVVGFFQQAAERYRALLAAIPDPIARYDADGRSLPLETGDPEVATVGPPLRLLEEVPSGVATRLLGAARDALTSRRMQTLDYETLAGDGTTRFLEARIVPSGDEDVLVIARDFTVQRAAEDELRASRARIVAAGDEARRRLERDLHDGAQQRLVALVVALRVLHAKATGRVDDELLGDLEDATDELKAGLAELRDLAQGIHPAVLTEAGLAAGLTALAERSAIPARVLAVPEGRLPAEVEATAYFIASEGLTNAAKHAAAGRLTLGAELRGDRLEVTIRDDGVGGAAAAGGTGLRGLRDRVEALGGDLTIVSPPGEGTTITAHIPVADLEAGSSDAMSGIPHGAG